MNRQVIGRIPSIYIPLIVLLVLNVWMNPNLLSVSGINHLALQVMPVVFAVMAQTVVLIVRELDISIGAMISLSTVLLASSMGELSLLSVLLVILAAIVIGGITGALIAYLHVPGIVVTLATSMVISGLALIVMPQPGGIISEAFRSIIAEHYLLLPNSLLILIIIVLGWKYLKNTPLGQSIYATGGNYFSSYASGIPVNKAKIIAFILSAVFASFAGMVLATQTFSGDANIGNPYTLMSIAGAILGGASFQGGIGSMKGAIGGAIVISILVNILFFMGIPSFYQYIVNGSILIIAFLFSLRKKPLELGG